MLAGTLKTALMVTVSPLLTGLGLGLALASAPGPVQAVLVAEAMRGGVYRGLRALAGANLTFGLLLVGLALGLSVLPPSQLVVRLLEVAGGAFLIWLAVDGLRSGHIVAGSNGRKALPAAARGALAVLLNPGSWLFLGAVASPLFAGPARIEGPQRGLEVAAVMVCGLAVGDGAVVLLGGLGLHRAGARVRRWVLRGLAAVLAGIGILLLIRGVIG